MTRLHKDKVQRALAHYRRTHRKEMLANLARARGIRIARLQAQRPPVARDITQKVTEAYRLLKEVRSQLRLVA